MLQDKGEKQINAIIDKQNFLADHVPQIAERAHAMVVVWYESKDRNRFKINVAGYGCTFVEILGLLELAKDHVTGENTVDIEDEELWE